MEGAGISLKGRAASARSPADVDVEGHDEGTVQRRQLRTTQPPHIRGQAGLGQTDKLVTVKGALVLEAFVHTHLDLTGHPASHPLVSQDVEGFRIEGLDVAVNLFNSWARACNAAASAIRSRSNRSTVCERLSPCRLAFLRPEMTSSDRVTDVFCFIRTSYYLPIM